HGLDLVTKITAPRPPAPRWVAIEVKTRMGNEVPFPSLSEAQQEANYLQEKVDSAIDGIASARRAVRTGSTRGRSWEDMIEHLDDIEDFEDAVGREDVTKILARAEVDTQGQLVGQIQAMDW
ncbi:hypothetical protein BC777_3905, partial [Yoonia maricola]